MKIAAINQTHIMLTAQELYDVTRIQAHPVVSIWTPFWTPIRTGEPVYIPWFYSRTCSGVWLFQDTSTPWVRCACASGTPWNSALEQCWTRTSELAEQLSHDWERPRLFESTESFQLDKGISKREPQKSPWIKKIYSKYSLTIQTWKVMCSPMFMMVSFHSQVERGLQQD